MAATLPAGYTWRRATLDDAAALHALISDYNVDVIGYADATVTDLRNDLAEPGFDPRTDSWLGYTPDGTLAGFAWAMGKGTGEQVDVDVISRDHALVPWMYDRVLERAAELARAGGHRHCTVDKGTYRQDTRARADAERHGFAPATAFHRMRVDHTGLEPEPPTAPAGVTLHSGPGDEEFRRTAHAVLNGAFEGHFGWMSRPFDEWQRKQDLESTFDWSQLTVAELDGRPVAVLIANDSFVEDEDCGYVESLGVLGEARGRGIAKYLLRTAFAIDRKAGRAGTILHVDTNNTTPALGVYESVGMRAVLVIDMWRRTVAG
jgi:mycothiol synthase